MKRDTDNAKIGSIVPVIEVLPYTFDPVEYFMKLSNYGNKSDCLLFESADIIPKYGERSMGSAEPCLKLTGKNENFKIAALNGTGRRFLNFIKDDFGFCDGLEVSKDGISGKLRPERAAVSEGERIRLRNHMDIIRKVAFKFRPATGCKMPYAGLFGCISYDFIDQFEDLPKNKKDVTEDPDYVLYFLDSLFLIDHKENRTYLISNALITDHGRDYHAECRLKIEKYKKAIKEPAMHKAARRKSGFSASSDTSKPEFVRLVNRLKGHIEAGDVYQAVLSRTITANTKKEPLDIYKKLKQLNPSPYMFYINMGEGVLLGASPEMSLRVSGANEKIVEIRPIAGTKPRGIIHNKIDMDIDSRYETELKTDAKEISEHTMLVDLARNDIARISQPGTRYVDEPFLVEKYSHVQHLVSNVRGVLKPELDALHAYLATMNMGTLTGAPKVEAMKLLRMCEKTKRGFYGGSVCYLTPNGDFDSAIVIRSIRIKNKKAYIRAGAGIVYDSKPESEFTETERKAQACIKALEDADG